jgi:hypothetical protein
MLIYILNKLVPNAQFTIRGIPTNSDEYANNVEWYDTRQKPTWAEIENIRNTAENEVANRKAERLRAADFRIEADPLFFGWQRGENTQHEWLDKVAEIRARHPYIQ